MAWSTGSRKLRVLPLAVEVVMTTFSPLRAALNIYA